MPNDLVFNLEKNMLHLGLGATCVVQPPFTGMEWYAAYGQRHDSDGKEGRLVSIHTFSSSWDAWEMHPVGEELVLCLEGEITLTQEIEGAERKVTLKPGEGFVNAAGVWHTADVDSHAKALFITAGLGTEHRAR